MGVDIEFGLCLFLWGRKFISENAISDPAKTFRGFRAGAGFATLVEEIVLW